MGLAATRPHPAWASLWLPAAALALAVSWGFRSGADEQTAPLHPCITDSVGGACWGAGWAPFEDAQARASQRAMCRDWFPFHPQWDTGFTHFVFPL